jgi:RNA polymerase sigma-70 factor, ECF subfamily
VSTLAGDDESRDRFRALYESNYAAILGYALRRAPRDEAADVVADVFLTAWRRLADVPRGDEARLWLYGTVRRVLANRTRSERRRSRLSARLLREGLGARSLEAPQHSGAVAAAFERVRPEDRELLCLVAWEGLAPEEAARILGCSSNAVRIRLHRARRRFAEELEAEPPPISEASLEGAA